MYVNVNVLIPIVVEDGLVLIKKISDRKEQKVLILIVVEDGLVPPSSMKLLVKKRLS